MLKTFPRGDTKLIKLRIRDQNDIPVDITDWIFHVSFKISTVTADTAAGNLTVKINLATSDPLGLKYRDLSAINGTVTLRLGPELTKVLIAGETYFYDIQRVLPIVDGGSLLQDHDVWTILSGKVKILDDVTRNYLEGTIGEVYP